MVNELPPALRYLTRNQSGIISRSQARQGAVPAEAC